MNELPVSEILGGKMDRIIKAHLVSFAKEQSLEALPESKQFEHFANFSIISKLLRVS